MPSTRWRLADGVPAAAANWSPLTVDASTAGGIDRDWLRPDWAVPGAGALMTTRRGGVSRAPFDSLNVRDGIGDRHDDVMRNRRRLADAISADAGATVRPFYLNQVHGTRVVRLTGADLPASTAAAALREPAEHTADASVTTEIGIACTAQVADCLPVLFAAPGGVGAAHAGWRGLAAGVLETALAALCDAAGCRPAEVSAWLGACIGPRRFEVGADVLRAFGADRAGATAALRSAFVRCETPDGRIQSAADFAVPATTRRVGGVADKWLADLPALARQRLLAVGIGSVGGGGWCTAGEPSRFFSYRRDGVTGRMVAVVWRLG